MRMSFKVFISHSVSPKELAVVYTLAEEAIKKGMSPFVPDRMWNPKEETPERIRQAINECDSVVVFGTKYGTHIDWLKKELDESKKFNKKFIALLDPEISLDGAELESARIKIDPRQLSKTIKEAANYLESMKLKKNQEELLVWIVIGSLLFLLISGKE